MQTRTFNQGYSPIYLTRLTRVFNIIKVKGHLPISYTMYAFQIHFFLWAGKRTRKEATKILKYYYLVVFGILACLPGSAHGSDALLVGEQIETSLGGDA